MFSHPEMKGNNKMINIWTDIQTAIYHCTIHKEVTSFIEHIMAFKNIVGNGDIEDNQLVIFDMKNISQGCAIRR